MLIDIQISPPPFETTQNVATDELKKRMAVRPAVARMIDAASYNSGIEKRHLVIKDGDINSQERFYSRNGEFITPTTSERMNEYEKWSKQLTETAVDRILQVNNIIPRSIDHLITISCTGFFAPGIDYHIINKFGLKPEIKRTNIGFMGCAASVIGFARVMDALASGAENVLVVSVEICSLHLQSEPTRDNILANIIFADGCAAALFTGRETENKFKLLNTASFLFNSSAEFMGWKIGNNGFEMMLSSELPIIILNEAVPQLVKTIDQFGIKKEEIKHWALHPGGRAILDSLQKGLQLTDEQMCFSKTVLKNYGNMSSASIMYVIKEILTTAELKKGDYCCAVAFGPGLTMETALFIYQ